MKDGKSLLSIFSCLILSCATLSTVSAQESAAIYLGPFDVVPALGVEVIDNDNIFQQASGSETASTLTLVRPSISASTDDGVFFYAFNYELVNGTYSDTDDSDYTDHSLSADLAWKIDVRHLFEFRVGIDQAHDSRSSDGVTALTAADLDEFDDRQFSTRYTFGTPESRGRIIVNYETNSIGYRTNRATTSVLDSDNESFDVSLSVAVGASSRAVVQVVNSDTDFDNNSAQNRRDRSYLVGVNWEVTGFTTGEARFGQEESELLNSGSTESTSTGSLSLEWSPYEHSTFTVSATKGAQNTSNNVGFFTKTTELEVGWNHQWSDELSMEISLSKTNDNFIGANRRDDTETAQLGFNYAVRRWLNLGVSVGVEERNSDLAGVEYDSNIVTFSLSASL